ncbi:MAG: kelch repeat-containing protein, partial [Candidatus Bathyarchaeota archaeon]
MTKTLFTSADDSIHVKMYRIKSTVVVLLVLSLTSIILSLPTVWGIEDSWALEISIPTIRSRLGVAAVNGKIYAIGGINDSGYLSINEEYDPITKTWITKAPMPTPRSDF